jgi:hypothetical protein
MLDYLFEHWIYSVCLWHRRIDIFLQIEGLWNGKWHFAAIEHIGNDREISVLGELVGDELDVGEVHAEDVGHNEDCIFWAFVVFWVGDVCADWWEVRYLIVKLGVNGDVPLSICLI